jgi:hypothetical protein
MMQYMTYDTTVDSDIWCFEGVFKMPYGAIVGGSTAAAEFWLLAPEKLLRFFV